LMGVIIYVAVRRGLAPLQRLTDKVSTRTLGDTSALSDARVPIEALPLTHALDQLLERLQQSLRREQRFIADATHELRTPLAGIKTQAQVAQAACNESQRAQALEGINQGVDHAASLISQLLTLARLDQQSQSSQPEVIDLAAAVDEVCMALSSAASAAGAQLSVTIDAAGPVCAERTLLSALLRNLIENAIQYGGSPNEVSIRVAQSAGGAVLTVTDQGPGIPEQDLQRVFERFYRSGDRQVAGSGLGLAIVASIAASCDAEVALSNNPAGGLSVTVSFGAVGQ